MCVVLQVSCTTHKHTSTLPDTLNASEIFSDPEQPPYYLHEGPKGLLNDLYTTLLKTVPVTQECISARAVVRYDILEDGQIDTTSIKVIVNKYVPDDYLKVAIEAIKGLGKFEPAKMNGIPIKWTWNHPIIYPVPIDLINTSE